MKNKYKNINKTTQGDLNMTTDIQARLNALDTNRIYELHYVYNFDLRNSRIMSFSSEEIKTAIHNLADFRKVTHCDDCLSNTLKDLIETSGRSLINVSFAERHNQGAQELTTCANDGCVECRKELEKNLAAYIALHIIENAQQENLLSDIIPDDGVSRFFVFDSNDTLPVSSQTLETV